MARDRPRMDSLHQQPEPRPVSCAGNVFLLLSVAVHPLVSDTVAFCGGVFACPQGKTGLVCAAGSGAFAGIAAALGTASGLVAVCRMRPAVADVARLPTGNGDSGRFILSGCADA